jgi:hypothetical protein
MFDLLASADLLVPHAPPVVASYAARLGILPARGAVWAQTWPEWGFDSHWCRVRRDLTAAPTQVEIIAPLPEPDPSIGHPHMAEIAAQQGSRMHKTHSVPIAIADLDALVRRLSAVGATFRLDPPEGRLPFPRLWLGRVAGRPMGYDPEADGGLYLEFIATVDLGMPIVTEPAPPAPTETGVSRVTAKTVLVDDLDEVLRTLDRNLGLTPGAAIGETAGARRARLAFTHVNSAALELIQPTDADSPEGRYRARWGAGPYGMRLEVVDLEAAAARLQESETPYTEAAGEYGRTLLPDPRVMSGPQVELVQGLAA